MAGKNLYICVTKDKYRLPIAVADSPTELAEMLGVDRSSVQRAIKKFNFDTARGKSRTGSMRECRYELENIDNLLGL